MMMRKQVGITISGFMTWAVIFSVVALLGFKIGPAYWEDVAIKKLLKTMATDPGLASGNRSAIERAFQIRTAVDNIKAIGPKDIEVAKEGAGIVLSATYTTRVPLIYNISACMDFNPSSK